MSIIAQVSYLRCMSNDTENKVAPMGRYFIAYGFNHRTEVSDDITKPCKGNITLDAYLYSDVSPIQGLNSCAAYKPMACAVG